MYLTDFRPYTNLIFLGKTEFAMVFSSQFLVFLHTKQCLYIRAREPKMTFPASALCSNRYILHLNLTLGANRI